MSYRSLILHLLMASPEHRASPADTELLNLPYYGGAEGNVLVYHPTLGLSPALKPRDEEGGEDSVTIQPPPKTASVAEVRPVGLAIAGIGGVAASKPTGTAVVGPGGLAIARPIATAIAGVPPDAVLGPGPEGPGQQEGNPSDEGTDKHIYHPAHVPVAVGPSRGGTKYGVIPMARSYPVNYVRVQPNSIQYTQQPLLLYPIAFY